MRVAYCLLLCLSLTVFRAPAQETSASSEGFSFIHLSDPHVDPWFQIPEMAELQKARSFTCVRTITGLGEIELAPYGITAPKPSFIINTGDIAEYGHPAVTWDVTDKYFGDLGMPIYYAAGNHDNTWVATTEHFRKLHGGQNYSFDRGGIHFVGLNSSSLQDPSPSFSEEVLEFLRSDLKKLGKTKPAIIYFHHPLIGNEFCSRFDVDQLMDIIRGYNVPVILDGHGHSSVVHDFWGIPGVQGGSTFGKADQKTSGYNIVDIRDGQVSIAYMFCGDTSATKEMLQKKIPERSPYPVINVNSPADRSTVRSNVVSLEATIDMDLTSTEPEVQQPAQARRNEMRPRRNPGRRGGRNTPAAPPAGVTAWYSLDDETTGELQLTDGRATGKLRLAGMRNGAHYIRFNFANPAGGDPYFRSVRFFVERPETTSSAVAQWRFRMGGGSKSTPLIHRGRVYVGCNDGFLYAIGEKTGKLAWKFNAGAEILAAPAAWNNLVLFGAGNGKFFAVDPAGKKRWEFDAERAAYSSPVVADDVVYFGTNDARFYALDAGTGEFLWKNTDAKFAIESKPAVRGDHVYFGAWDGNVYGLDRKTGTTVWKSPGPHNQSITGNLTRYYAPGDNGPVTTSDSLFICDRAYKAGKYGFNGDFQTTISADATAISASAAGDALYVRGIKTPISKIGLDGSEIWMSSVVTGRIPVSPTESGRILYVCTNSGTLYALDTRTGRSRAQYQVTPRLYVMSGVSTRGRTVFTSALDGYVTAVRMDF